VVRLQGKKKNENLSPASPTHVVRLQGGKKKRIFRQPLQLSQSQTGRLCVREQGKNPKSKIQNPKPKIEKNK